MIRAEADDEIGTLTPRIDVIDLVGDVDSVPALTGELIHIVALSGPDGAPDLATVKAFRLAPGIGLNMGRDVWHASRSNGVTLVMLTRSKTSTDMAQFQNKKGPLAETALRETAPIRLLDPI